MDGAPVLKRPKPTDSEEELFRMQEEFLRNKQKPSAKVINLRGSTKNVNIDSTQSIESQTNSGKVQSKFSKMKGLKGKDKVFTSQTSGNVMNPLIKESTEKHLEPEIQESVQNVPIAPSRIILGNIVEKKHDVSCYKFDKQISPCFDTGFPKAFVSTNMKNEEQQSLFWLQVHSNQPVTSKLENCKNTTSLSTSRDCDVKDSLANEIHNENVEKLSHMSEEDILKHKTELETMLRPELIEFLRNKKNKKDVNIDCVQSEKLIATTENQSRDSVNEEKLVKQKILDEFNVDSFNFNDVPMQVDAPEQNLPKPSIDIMKEAKKKGWMHMDSLEPEKLKWMKDIAVKDNEPDPNESYNARFDFNGVLLPYKDENVPIEKGLHHHGEEPERPGYSLQELLQLSRSSAQQQCCTALTTLANIMEKSRKGWYDKILDPPPLTTLNQKNILLLLRFSLDNTSLAVVTASLKALRAFLYSEADEICLDRLYGFCNYEEPILAAPKTDVNDSSNLKDHELAQLDTIAALLRTDILLRIRYILSEMRPPPVGVTCALEILIRLIRHSSSTATEIVNTPHLLETIIENFMPFTTDSLVTSDVINNVYGVPVITAVRFCRILVCYGKESITSILNNFKIIQRIMSYVSCDAGKASFMLSIESLRLWKALLLHGEATDSLTGAQLILISQLQLLLSNHDIQIASELSCEYAAALIAVASCLSPLKTNISVLLAKWSTQLLSLNNITWGNTKLIAETLLAVSDIAAIKTLIISRTQVFSKLGCTSNLLSECTLITEREPSCLPHLGVLTQDGQLQPIVSQHSCIPFLATVLNVFIKYTYIEEIQAVLSLPQLQKYLIKLINTDWSLENSWYTRNELFFLTAIVHAASLVKDKLDSNMSHIIWKLTIKLISSLPADHSTSVKNMLRIAFTAEKINLEVIINELDKLKLESSIENIKLNLSGNIAGLYEQYVQLNGTWEQAALPKDWLYLPVVHIYAQCRNNMKCSDRDKSAILAVLSLELILPYLVEKLSQNLRFSRLVLVYLCDTLYLNNDVSALLTRTLSILLKANYKKLDFTVDVPGLNSFTDLFTAMCEHFCSTSYGDYGFSMALLVPIAQRHNVHYRKLLWSEHAGLLRYIRLPLEELVIPLKEYFFPLEVDISLIESYITALVRGVIKHDWCPIPYAIAVHHSAMYLKQSNKLAMRMRMQLEKIPDKVLATLLLNYQPPTL